MAVAAGICTWRCLSARGAVRRWIVLAGRQAGNAQTAKVSGRAPLLLQQGVLYLQLGCSQTAARPKGTDDYLEHG